MLGVWCCHSDESKLSLPTNMWTEFSTLEVFFAENSDVPAHPELKILFV